MFVMGVRKDFLSVFRRCLYNDTRQSLPKRRIQPKTSGIIGDEVLKGQVVDTNSSFLCKQLYNLGIHVMAVSKVVDDIQIISEEVKKFSNKYDYVLTTGGIGPTHDDITYEAISKAFNVTMYRHPELSELILKFYKSNDSNHPALKMAHIPSNAKLTYGYDSISKKQAYYPTVSVENVFIYPGVPFLCERLFNLTKEKLFSSPGKFHLRKLYLTQNESLLVNHLNDAVLKFPNVMFGSYPIFFHSYYSVKITMQSIDEIEVDEAFMYLKQLIPDRYHVDYDSDPYSKKLEKITRLKDETIAGAMSQLENLFKINNSDDIFLYFDGGKNSTILLYLASALFEKTFPGVEMNAIYVETNPKVGSFVRRCVDEYKLNLLKLSEYNFRHFVGSHPKICLIRGVRKSDEKSLVTMKSMENVTLVNPLLNWSYGDVWNSIRRLYLPYCELYDQGFTSISRIDAGPNPNLITSGPRSDLTYYKKAFELDDEKLEYVV